MIATAMKSALLAVVVAAATGCAPMRTEAPPALVPLDVPGAPPRTLPTPAEMDPAPAPTTTSPPMVLQVIPPPIAPGTEFEMTPEQFFETFGVWPTCDAVATQDWACL